MRKHFYRFLAIAVMAAVVHGSMMPAAAMPDATVDTITLETEAATEEVPVDYPGRPSGIRDSGLKRWGLPVRLRVSFLSSIIRMKKAGKSFPGREKRSQRTALGVQPW